MNFDIQTLVSEVHGIFTLQVATQNVNKVAKFKKVMSLQQR